MVRLRPRVNSADNLSPIGDLSHSNVGSVNGRGSPLLQRKKMPLHEAACGGTKDTLAGGHAVEKNM